MRQLYFKFWKVYIYCIGVQRFVNIFLVITFTELITQVPFLSTSKRMLKVSDGKYKYSIQVNGIMKVPTVLYIVL
jgi:hypothetical protein